MNDSLETISNPLTKEEVTFIETAEQTGGVKTVVKILLGPNGKGPPLHYHTSFTERFEVLEGELMLRVGKEVIRLKAGEQAIVEIGQHHTFWSEMDMPVKFRGTIQPGDVEFENCFRIAFGLVRDGYFSDKGVPKKLSHMAILTAMSQSNLSGGLSLFSGLFKLLVRTQSSRKVKQELIHRYCSSRVDDKA